jgi:hypothetical protein
MSRKPRQSDNGVIGKDHAVLLKEDKEKSTNVASC